MILAVALLAGRPAVAQWWGLGAQTVPAGVMGQSILRIDYFDSAFGDYHETRRYRTSIDIRTAAGRYVKSVQTDAQGRFLVSLRPGKYILAPRATSITHTAHPLRINVRSAKFVSVTVISTSSGYSGGRSTGSSWRWLGPLPPLIGPTSVITVCHRGVAIQVDGNALSAHLNHGDTIGPCP